MDAIETFKTSFNNIENLFITLAKENKNRSVHVVKKILAINTQNADREKALRIQSTSQIKHISERLNTMLYNMQDQFLKTDGATMILRRMVEDKIKTVHDKFDFYALEEDIKRWTSK